MTTAADTPRERALNIVRPRGPYESPLKGRDLGRALVLAVLDHADATRELAAATRRRRRPMR
jgi:hypothetical protein